QDGADGCPGAAADAAAAAGAATEEEAAAAQGEMAVAPGWIRGPCPARGRPRARAPRGAQDGHGSGRAAAAAVGAHGRADAPEPAAAEAAGRPARPDVLRRARQLPEEAAEELGQGGRHDVAAVLARVPDGVVGPAAPAVLAALVARAFLGLVLAAVQPRRLLAAEPGRQQRRRLRPPILLGPVQPVDGGPDSAQQQRPEARPAQQRPAELSSAASAAPRRRDFILFLLCNLTEKSCVIRVSVTRVVEADIEGPRPRGFTQL
ncbi:hypothetical protein FOCC_FOCC013679, partial [Frankliniella occidentalis]